MPHRNGETLVDRILLKERAQRVYAQQDAEHRALTDRLFSVLAVVLWTATIALFSITLHPEQVSFATMAISGLGLLVAGLAFVAVPIVRTIRHPGHPFNPFLAALSLSTCVVLFERVSGRSDSILAAFVVLAFLAFYRDIRALALATAIIVGEVVFRTLDTHNIFGSLFEFVSARSEDVMWLLIFDLVLYASISRISVGLRRGSAQQANLEVLQEESEQTIAAADSKLLESESVKAIIFEAAPDGVIRYDADSKIIEINSVAEKMLRSSKGEAAGRDICEFLPQLNPGAPSNGRVLEMEIRRADGTLFIAEYCTSEVVGLESKQFAMFVRDISERKALESQLSQSQKLQSIGQLAAGIAHEINTPTQYVGDNTLFLSDAFTDVCSLLDVYDGFEETIAAEPEFEENLKRIEGEKERADLTFLRVEIPKAIKESLDGIERISVIVRALKDFSHPGVEGMTAADINRILESTATVARNEWKYVADLELELSPTLPPILCLPGELGQVALNLIVNASHAIADKMDGTGEKGRIVISTARDGQHITVKVSDNGGGIPAEVRDRVFDPFFTTKEVGKGTGQGLAIAHNVIVEHHKGALWFETEEGKGTTFIFRIPLDQANSEGDQAAA